MWDHFFWSPKGPSGQKMLFKKGTFCNFLPFLGLTSNAIFSVNFPCRKVFNTILENYKEKSFQKWFWNLSHVFGSGHKMHFKKTIFDVFCRFYGLTSDAIFSVIWPCRIVFNTILENYKEKSFQKWFWNLSHIFGSGHKMHFKKTIFDVFCQFFGPTFICNFLSHLLM